jgi:PIN domain nuclease of toxin-antitoxin system
VNNGIALLEVRREHAAAVERLPLHHRDPFDRLLVCQAMIEKMDVVSADAALDGYAIRRVW